MMDRLRDLWDAVKLKHVWFLTALVVVYLIWRQGLPSPALDNLILKLAAIWVGALAGMCIDAVHFREWPPKTGNVDYENRRRRAAFIIAGMLAGALSV
jgi:peptidoglycan/LPS O-acetylase OafA/YrhL